MATEIEELKRRVAELTEAKEQLQLWNQKLAEDSTYAKGLASAAAVKLKALSEEVAKLMNHNDRLSAEMVGSTKESQDEDASYSYWGQIQDWEQDRINEQISLAIADDDKEHLLSLLNTPGGLYEISDYYKEH
ncbi:hypothetical protein RHGRI_006211 [Rhododendron griersonianum]|uniref:Uncharacterized protein n=1 Tax=Rhododendron griersonianum TaxID=479676 RepID=A0AAV6KSP1_9ERIC|nr:hypothetical protein RHGRI_006211 [Rhododendron griersonianum]